MERIEEKRLQRLRPLEHFIYVELANLAGIAGGDVRNNHVRMKVRISIVDCAVRE